MEKVIVVEALNSKFKDLQDALQNFSANKSGIIDAIITRNIKNYTNRKTGGIIPDNFLRTITAVANKI